LEGVSKTIKRIPAEPRWIFIPRKGTISFTSIEQAILCLAVFLAPYSHLRIGELFFTASDLLFGVSLICLLLSRRMPASPLGGATPVWLVAFALLFGGLMMSSLVNGDAMRGAIVLAQYFFSYVVLMMIMVRDDVDLVHLMAAAFVVGLFFVDIHGIITFYTVGYVPGEGKGIVTGGKRLATVLRNPNLAAAMNALAMPFLLYFWSSGRWSNLIAFPVFIVFLLAVVLTSSNGGLLVTVLCLLVFIALVITPKLLLHLSLGGAALIATFISLGGETLLPNTFRTRVLGAISSGDISEAGTFVSRSDLMKEALTVISDKGILVLGLGADQFREISVQSAPVHNLYLLLWVEGGIFALLGWLLFATVGAQIWLALLKAGGSKQVLATIASTVSVLLAMAMFNAHMYARYWTVPLLLAYGLGIAHLRQRSQAKVRPR
jgi:O-antigen ligase